MKDHKVNLAIFDFDGTLTRGHSWAGFAKYDKEHNIRKSTLFTYFVTHIPYLIAARLKLYGENKNRIRWGEDLPVFIKGLTLQDAQGVFKWITENYFMPLMRKDVIEVLENHRNQGHKIVLLSGMFIDFLEVLRKRIGADYALGTKLEVRNNVYSGKIVKPLCFGEIKAKFLTNFIEKEQLSIDFSQSSAYADSIYDAPVFELVGNPVAVYPDKPLFDLAQRENWRVIGHPGL
jgi:HAD superfamily hydrolase (TIGR01490 family)